jgi:hypothetical protein
MTSHRAEPAWTPQRVLGTFTRRSGDGLLIETYHDGYEVNASGAFIWSQIDSRRTSADISERVAEHYALDASVAREVVDGFLAELLGRGFVAAAVREVTSDKAGR